ncbi:hypothetical protein AB0F17_51155 [Nonomuraea sp. NPDC026600]|uniref:hypothetical protein n=1 Tax=Nonomuraea sp. NPDC026600 TaxID=3155363 RepID=UPI0033C6C753
MDPADFGPKSALNDGGPSAHGQKSVGRDPDTTARRPATAGRGSRPTVRDPEPIAFGPVTHKDGPATAANAPETAANTPETTVNVPETTVNAPETPVRGSEAALRDRDATNPPTESQGLALAAQRPDTPAEPLTAAAKPRTAVRFSGITARRKLDPETMRKPGNTTTRKTDTATTRKADTATPRKADTATSRKPGTATSRKLATAVGKPQRSTQRTAGVDLTRVKPRAATVHMSHALAADWLRDEGLRTKSSGHCTNRNLFHCTSLEDVRTSTITRVIELKRQSSCPIMVTGGTETGHAPGRFSHGKGYKLDITHNSCIDRYITKKHEKSGTRGDGAALYRSPTGTVFADEIDHWDILFR